MQPVSSPYAVRFDVDYPDRTLNRLTTAFRIFVAIPILIVVATVSGASIGVGRNQGGAKSAPVTIGSRTIQFGSTALLPQPTARGDETLDTYSQRSLPRMLLRGGASASPLLLESASNARASGSAQVESQPVRRLHRQF
jgi:hypothetical protein